MTASVLLDELRGLGVVLSLQGDRIAFDAPSGALNDDLLARLRAGRDGLLKILSPESQKNPTERQAQGEDGDAACKAKQTEGRSSCCLWCGSSDLVDDLKGVRCNQCDRVNWIDLP